MENLLNILRRNIKKYPMMEIKDSIKIIYQNEFGGGHLIEDEEKSLTFLEDEYKSLDKTLVQKNDLFEYIGNGISRLNLSEYDSLGIPLYYLNRLFMYSSNNKKGDLNRFKHKLELIYELDKFSNIEEVLNDYKDNNYPPISHSQIYRENYNPHYRVFTAECVKALPVIAEIVKFLSRKKNVVLSIDGRSASGKTTMSGILNYVFDSQLIHMDDFFLPKELRTKERYNEPGGNFHHERFIQQVSNGIKSGGSFEYDVFSCEKMNYTDRVTVNPANLYIVEGSYSSHPKIKDLYDLNIFLNIDSGSQIKRIEKRNGTGELSDYVSKWIPLEEKYFKHYNIMENSDFIVTDTHYEA